MIIFKLLLSQWVKTKRSGLRFIILMVPIVYPIFILWYFSQYEITDLLQVKIYSVFFEVISVALTIIIALLTALIVIEEELAGDFRGFLLTPFPRKKLYNSKLSFLIILTIIDIFISTAIMLFGMKFILKISDIQYQIFLVGAISTVIGSLFLYCLHLLISFAYGTGPSIAMGIVGFLISAILGVTSLGDSIWQFIPWAWGARLSKIPVILMPMMKEIGGNISSKLFLNQFIKGVIPSVGSSIIIIVLGSKWFERWEGR